LHRIAFRWRWQTQIGAVVLAAQGTASRHFYLLAAILERSS
jgi:hypothetical protein